MRLTNFALAYILAPLNAEVKVLSSTALEILMVPPADECGIDRYTANISDNGSLSCELKKRALEFSCIIRNLSPLTEYIVNITAWLSGKFGEVGSKVRKRGWTRPPSEFFATFRFLLHFLNFFLSAHPFEDYLLIDRFSNLQRKLVVIASFYFFLQSTITNPNLVKMSITCSLQRTCNTISMNSSVFKVS